MTVTRNKLKAPPKYPSMSVKAGVLEAATYPADMLTDARTGKQVPDRRAGMHVATIAAALEYGHSQAHPRPFMQNTVANHKSEWARAAVARMVRDRMPVAQALRTVGQVMKEDIQLTIAEWPADNSAEWAAFKGFDHGLVHTNHLHDSIDFEVDEGSKS